ncbi:hypothetical protein BH11PSE8_BH11PSE8_40410 [soil metagenome]
MFEKVIVHGALALSALAAAGLAQAAGYGSNLIVNGGAEAGTSGWTGYTGIDIFSAVEYGSNWVLPTQPGPADRGANLFVGGSGVAYAAASQEASLASFASAISTGKVGYTLSGWLGGWLAQEDSAQLTARFFDASSNVIASTTLGPGTPASRNGETGLFAMSTGGYVPTGAASVQFVLEMNRLDGGDNDGYADNLAFTLTSAVPEPESHALMLAGLGALGFVTRRRTSVGRG